MELYEEKDALKRQQNKLDELIPIVIYKGGMHFGELALMRRAPRAGTVVTLSDCYFATIKADSYEKLMKKDHAFNLSSNVRFLKQVPYINDWMDRQIQGLFHLCKEVKTDVYGSVIVREDEECKFVYLVTEGEVEVVKTDLKKVFFNQQRGIVGIKEGNKK